MVSLIAYLIALISKQPAETLPLRLLVIVAAATVAALVRCVLIPERPEAEIKRLRHAVRGGLGKVLALLAAAVEAGAWTAASRRDLRRQISQLDEIIMVVQARLASLVQQPAGQGWSWLQLLEIQLATRRVGQIALRDLGAPEERATLLSRIELIGAGGQQAPPFAAPGRLGEALDMLGRALSKTPSGEADYPASDKPATAAGWRPALQTAAASALAIACSEADPSRPLVLGGVRGLRHVPGNAIAWRVRGKRHGIRRRHLGRTGGRTVAGDAAVRSRVGKPRRHRHCRVSGLSGQPQPPTAS